MKKAKPKAFVAFPSNPPSIKEIQLEFVSKINKTDIVDLYPWTDMSISGKPIISEICKNIDDSDLFLADITYHNSNVLFELGYAIAKKKRVWLLHDSSTDKARERFLQVGLFKPIGYTNYTNSAQIVDAYYQDLPHDHLDDTPYDTLVEPALSLATSESEIFYLKSHRITEASRQLTRHFKRSKLKTIDHDPSEKSEESISWYLNHAVNSAALIAHLDSDDVTLAYTTNAKYAFVAGFAFGIGKKVLMLAHDPYDCPIDYELLLRTHKTAAQCLHYGGEWIGKVEQSQSHLKTKKLLFQKEVSEKAFLASINLGEHIAEHEIESISDYFVETGPYLEALNSTTAIFVGRKGTGKTANLYKVAQVHSNDVRNFVCVIKPTEYNTEAILNSLKNIHKIAEMGGVYESIWKYLIYSELMVVLYHEASKKQPHNLDDDELDIMRFCEESGLIYDDEFSTRLESRIKQIESLVKEKYDGNNAVRISEVLHGQNIKKMREKLEPLFLKKNKVIILVDNLDKAWKAREDISVLTDLIRGLLKVVNSIVVDFTKEKHWRDAIPISLLVFLRSDIYNRLIKEAREPDKIHTIKILWEDEDLLLRIIEERFISSNEELTPKHIWERLFPKTINGIPVKKFIVQAIYPRPRDAIVYIKNALSLAITRGHQKIEKRDLIDAREKYSEYALQSINVEDIKEGINVESGTFALIGMEQVFTEEKLMEVFLEEGISNDISNEMLEILCRLGVLGLETKEGEFTYCYDDDNYARLHKLSEIFSGKVRQKRFQVNSAICPALGIICD